MQWWSSWWAVPYMLSDEAWVDQLLSPGRKLFVNCLAFQFWIPYSSGTWRRENTFSPLWPSNGEAITCSRQKAYVLYLLPPVSSGAPQWCYFPVMLSSSRSSTLSSSQSLVQGNIDFLNKFRHWSTGSWHREHSFTPYLPHLCYRIKPWQLWTWPACFHDS